MCRQQTSATLLTRVHYLLNCTLFKRYSVVFNSFRKEIHWVNSLLFSYGIIHRYFLLPKNWLFWNKKHQLKSLLVHSLYQSRVPVSHNTALVRFWFLLNFSFRLSRHSLKVDTVSIHRYNRISYLILLLTVYAPGK